MMNDDATSRFIASLVKSLQSLCHGYVEFEKNIEIIGHIYVSVDSQQKFDYIVNEQVCKNDDESSTMFVSNSFHAQPNKKAAKLLTQSDVPLDLKTHPAKDVAGIDLSTFHLDTGQGRSASRESSQSLSAGSESGSFSGSVRESSLSATRQNPDKYISRRKRHLNEVSMKLSPDVSPPPSRNRDGERRDPHDSSLLRTQYTLGASASKLARRISNELEKQNLANPAPSDSEIHPRLSGSNHSPSRLGRNDNSLPHHRHFADDSSKPIDSVKDPPVKSESHPFDDSIDLTRVKEEVTDDDQLFDQLDWTRAGREVDQDAAFPRTGPDDPASEGRDANQHDDQMSNEELATASLYPVMMHQNTAGMSVAGYGSPVFPQSFTEPSHTMSAGSSPIPSTSGQLSPGSAFTARRGPPGGSGRGYNAQFTPRPGKVPQDVAANFNCKDKRKGNSFIGSHQDFLIILKKRQNLVMTNHDLEELEGEMEEVVDLDEAGEEGQAIHDPIVIYRGHFLEVIPPTGKKHKPQKRCRVCYSQGRRRKESRYQCGICPEKPGLCIYPCMKIYHDQRDIQVAANVQLGMM